MYKERVYHPRHAIANSDMFYDRAFQNHPRPWVVKTAGGLATKLTKPTIKYIDAIDHNDYFDRIDPDSSILVTFSHYGKRNLHDPISAITAMVNVEKLADRIPAGKAWVATPYITNRIYGFLIERVGGIPVMRSRDYDKYNLNPTEQEREAVTNTLVDRSVQHLKDPSSLLAIFPAGTKGGVKLREGVGMVLEKLTNTTVIPISIDSSSIETSNIPSDLIITLARPIQTETGLTRHDYVEKVDQGLGHHYNQAT